MSPMAVVCDRHKRLVAVGERCPECGDPQQARRSRRNRSLGRTSAHWAKLARRMVRRAGGVCPACGGIESSEDPGSKLTCDLVAGGDHSRAREADCRVRCRRCHGRSQGGRR